MKRNPRLITVKLTDAELDAIISALDVSHPVAQHLHERLWRRRSRRIATEERRTNIIRPGAWDSHR